MMWFRYFNAKTLLISVFLFLVVVLVLAISIVNSQSAKKIVNEFGRYLEESTLEEAISLFSSSALFESGTNKIDFKEAITQYIVFQSKNQLEGSLYTHEIDSIGYKNAVVVAVAWLYADDDSGEATVTFKLTKKSLFSSWKISSIKSDDAIFYSVFFEKK